jgi:hypothetical protein
MADIANFKAYLKIGIQTPAGTKWTSPSSCGKCLHGAGCLHTKTYCASFEPGIEYQLHEFVNIENCINFLQGRKHTKPSTAHALKRAYERYGTVLTPDDLEKMITHPDKEIIKKLNRRKYVYSLNYCGVKYVFMVIQTKGTRNIVTFLTPDRPL